MPASKNDILLSKVFCGALRALKDPGTLKRKEILDWISFNVEFDDQELELIGKNKNRIRWQVALTHNHTGLMKAGYIVKPRHGYWVITEEGRNALEELAPLDLVSHVHATYKEWDKARKNKGKRYWGIHAGSNDHHEGDSNRLFLEENYVGLGWIDLGDLSNFGETKQEFNSSIANIYPSKTKSQLTGVSRQLLPFVHGVNLGDIVVFNAMGSDMFHVGQISSKYFFVEEEDEPYPNRRKVNWLGSYPRSELSEKLSTTMSAAMTLFNLDKHADAVMDLVHRSNQENPLRTLPPIESFSTELLVEAINLIDSGHDHSFGSSSTYDVIHNDNQYPPKAVVGIAAELICGEKFGPHDFQGGRNTPCMKILTKYGITWTAKEKNTEDGIKQITKDQYISALLEIEQEMDRDDRLFLAHHYQSPEMATSMPDLAQSVYGKPQYSTANLHYGTLAGKICNHLGISPEPNLFGISHIDKEASSEEYTFTLRKPLAAALKDLGWTNPSTSGLNPDDESTLKEDANKKAGYVLYADPDWLSYHFKHSISKNVAYTRGSGAPMKNVQHHGDIFFIEKGESPLRIHASAKFDGYEILTKSESWEQNGRSLGSGSLVNYMDKNEKYKDSICVLGMHDFTKLRNPISFSEAGVDTPRSATKGWSLDSDEVRLLLSEVN